VKVKSLDSLIGVLLSLIFLPMDQSFTTKLCGGASQCPK
jgi:hypothetical protein